VQGAYTIKAWRKVKGERGNGDVWGGVMQGGKGDLGQKCGERRKKVVTKLAICIGSYQSGRTPRGGRSVRKGNIEKDPK